MATRYQIQLNYNNAMSQASDLDNLANELSSIGTRRINQSMQVLQTAWKGENGAAYQQKGQLLIKKTEETAVELRNAASVIRRIATNTYHAEMHALELAEKRKYSR